MLHFVDSTRDRVKVKENITCDKTITIAEDALI